MWQYKYYIFSLALVVFAGCSSAPHATDGSASDASATESKADAVGSIPEDMLADEKAPDASTDSAAPDGAAPEEAKEKDPATAEPFADLKDPDAKAPEAAQANTADNLTTTESEAKTSGSTETYTVKAGDTLMKIAFSIYGDIDRWKDLADWNKGTVGSGNHLKVGTELKYEAPLEAFHPETLGHSYTIRSGDTLANIADDLYGRKAKYKKLQKYNEHLIRNPNRIFAGFEIFYDITPKEMAEAEARRKEKQALANAAPAPAASAAPAPVPSVLHPAVPAAKPAAPVATVTSPPLPAPPAPASTPPKK